LVALLAAAPMATAQTTPVPPAAPAPATEAPATPAPTEEPAAIDGVSDSGLALGEEVQATGVGSTYVQSEQGDWEIHCVRTEDGNDPCQLYQLLEDSNGSAVASISIFGLPAGQQAAAGATVITPLETLLTAQLTLAVDNGNAKRY